MSATANLGDFQRAMLPDLSTFHFGCMTPWTRTDPRTGQTVPMTCRNRKKMCPECAKRFKRQWAGRCIAESNLWSQTAFVTLTYAEEHKPRDLQTGYEDVKLWLKTLRNHTRMICKDKIGQKFECTLPDRFRYFIAGELGPENDRPHWHCLLFGMPALELRPETQRVFPPSPMDKLKLRDTAWKRGFITWTAATVGKMTYATSYSLKKTDDHLSYFQPSRMPGLGHGYFEKVGAQAYHLGKLPQDIRSLTVGRTHFPLDDFGRQVINNTWKTLASVTLDHEKWRLAKVEERGWRDNQTLKMHVHRDIENTVL